MIGQLRISNFEFRHVLVISVAAVLLVAGLIRFLYMPQVARLAERRARLRELHASVAEVRALIGGRLAQEAALRAASTRYDEVVETRVGKRQSMSHILDLLSAQARTHRLEMAVSQGSPDDQDPQEGGERLVHLVPGVKLRELPLRVQLTGRYRSIGAWLAQLPEASMLASVQQLTLTRPQADRAMLQADLLLMVYFAERPRVE